jgi:thiosulfate dehydrogenase [quinone] large subunit
MTKRRAYLLTAASAALYLFLCWAFADHQFSGHVWDREAIADSNIFTYLLLIAIVAAGVYQAQRYPDVAPGETETAPLPAGQLDDPAAWKLLLGNVAWSIVWMPVRFFVGREWLAAGEEKLRSDAWMSGGTALKGFWTGAVAVPDKGRPAITYGWFRTFLQYMLDHEWYTWFAKIIAVGEFLVGIGLIVGALVGIAAFFGTVLNFNFQLAGSASTNPVLFGLGVLLVMAWKTAGWIGIDRVLLPRLGTPWAPGRKFVQARHTAPAAEGYIIPRAGHAD